MKTGHFRMTDEGGEVLGPGGRGRKREISEGSAAVLSEDGL